MKIKDMLKANATRKYRKSFSIILATLLLASSFPVKGGAALAASVPATSAAAAGSDFVYVTSSFASFSESTPERTFSFTLPSNVTGRGHIMVQAKGVDFGCHRFEINGAQVNVLVDRDGSNELHAEYNDISSGVLRGGANTLFIQTRNESCGLGGNLDNFSITNIVIFYRTQ